MSFVHLLAIPNTDGHGVASAQEAAIAHTGNMNATVSSIPNLSTRDKRTDRSAGSILGPALL